MSQRISLCMPPMVVNSLHESLLQETELTDTCWWHTSASITARPCCHQAAPGQWLSMAGVLCLLDVWLQGNFGWEPPQWFGLNFFRIALWFGDLPIQSFLFSFLRCQICIIIWKVCLPSPVAFPSPAFFFFANVYPNRSLAFQSCLGICFSGDSNWSTSWTHWQVFL